MGATNGIVFDLRPTAAAELVHHLADRQGRALALGGCAVELVADDLPHPRTLQAIVTWERAVPLKVERLAVAIMAAGGRLRRDLDADGVRHRAMVAGHHLVRVGTPADLEAFRRIGSPGTPTRLPVAFLPAA